MPRNQPPRIPARPFSLVGTPFDPKTGKHFPLSDSRVVEAFKIEQIGDNALLCRDSRNILVVVAKPWQFRRQEWDGQTFGGITYTWTALDTRTKTEGVDVETQTVGPAYFVDEWVLAAKRPAKVQLTVPPDDVQYAAEWEDMNNAGRTWAADGDSDNPLPLNYTGEHTEAAIVDSGWDITSQGAYTGFILTVQTGSAYYDAGDETWYAYFRDLTFTRDGRCVPASVETRVSIDVPEAC